MTHDVINQPPELGDLDLFTLDPVLPRLVRTYGAAGHLDHLAAYGRRIGSREAVAWGFDANRFTPELHTHDRFGHREDRVEFHPSYHSLMETGVAAGLQAAPWADDRPGSHVARAAKFITWSSVAAGHRCPLSMTYAVGPAGEAEPRTFHAEPFSREALPGERPQGLARARLTTRIPL